MVDGGLSYGVKVDSAEAEANLKRFSATVNSVSANVRNQMASINRAFAGIKAPNLNFGSGASGLSGLSGAAKQASDAAKTVGGSASAASTNVKNLGGSASSASPAFRNFTDVLHGFKGVLESIAIFEVGKELIKLSDEATIAANRVQSSTKTQAEANGVFAELVRISKETRSPLERTAEDFQQVTLATNALGLSYRGQIGLTKELNQLLAISGATGQRAKNGISDLLRGLAAGRITGQELRAMIHDIPALGQAIATGLGVGVGALKGMAKEGKLVPETVVPALQKIAPQIQATFAKMTPTIAGGFSVIKTSILETIQNFNQFSGAGAGISRVLIFIGENFSVFGTALAGVAAVIVASVIPAIVKLGLSLLLTPLGLIAASVGALTAALGYFGQSSLQVAGMTVSGWQIVRAVFATVGESFRNFVAFFSSGSDKIDGKTKDTAKAAQSSWADTLSMAQTAANGIIGAYVATFTVIKALWNNFPGFMNRVFVAVQNLAATAAEALLNIWQAPLRGLALVAGAIAPEVAKTINAGLDKISIRLPHAQASKEGKAFGDEVSAGVRQAFNTDYIGDFGKRVVGHLKTITAEAMKANEAVDNKHGGTAHSEGDEEGGSHKKKKQAVDEYAKALQNLQKDLYQVNLTEKEKALSDALVAAGLGYNITQTNKQADAIKNLQAKLQAGQDQKKYTDQLKKLKDASYELGLSEEQRAQVEARIAAGLPHELTVINEKTKAIDVQAAANFRAKKAEEDRAESANRLARLQEDLRNAAEVTKDRKDATQNPQNAELQATLTAIERVRQRRLLELNTLKLTVAKQKELTDTINHQANDDEAQVRLEDQLEKTERLRNFMVDLWENPKAAMKQFFSDFLTQLLTSIAKATILKGLLGAGAGGGSFGSMISGAFASALGFGGARENGGSVAAGKAYLVGEKRPEMFVPNMSGRIIPQVGGGASHVTVHGSTIIVQGGANDQTLQQMKAMQAASERRIANQIQRELAHNKTRGR